MSFPKLNSTFYSRSDTLVLGRELLGKILVTQIGNHVTAAKIVETEAYLGPEDKASHAHNNRRTNRTKTMFESGGICYVYLCYGIHQMFNIVTGEKGTPHAILIRALEPVEGMETMLKRRNLKKYGPRLTAGPGCLTGAMGITREHDGLSLEGNIIWIEDRGIIVKEKNIIASPRVGINYAEEYIEKPWRFRVKNSIWTSPAK